MAKYIIKAFNYDGTFYGFFAAHPDDPKNESFSYYVDEIKDAKRFDSYADADRIMERFEDGSELESIIIEVDDDSEGEPESHVFEQDKDGMIQPIEYVYMVTQTQPSCDYNQRTIYVYTSEEEAIAVARKLNKIYGSKDTCSFTEEGDFEYVNDDVNLDDTHYYEVESICLNKGLAPCLGKYE